MNPDHRICFCILVRDRALQQGEALQDGDQGEGSPSRRRDHQKGKGKSKKRQEGKGRALRKNKRGVLK